MRCHWHNRKKRSGGLKGNKNSWNDVGELTNACFMTFKVITDEFTLDFWLDWLLFRWSASSRMDPRSNSLISRSTRPFCHNTKDIYIDCHNKILFNVKNFTWISSWHTKSFQQKPTEMFTYFTITLKCITSTLMLIAQKYLFNKIFPSAKFNGNPLELLWTSVRHLLW